MTVYDEAVVLENPRLANSRKVTMRSMDNGYVQLSIQTADGRLCDMVYFTPQSWRSFLRYASHMKTIEWPVCVCEMCKFCDCQRPWDHHRSVKECTTL